MINISPQPHIEECLLRRIPNPKNIDIEKLMRLAEENEKLEKSLRGTCKHKRLTDNIKQKSTETLCGSVSCLDCGNIIYEI